MVSKLRIAVLIPDPHYDRVLVGDVPARLSRLGEVLRPSTAAEGIAAVLPAVLESVDVCLTGWGTPPLPVGTLGPTARLRLIAHTAGSVRRLIPVEAYAHGIQIAHAAPLLADAVAECTLLLILEGLRRVAQMDQRMKAGISFREAGDVYPGDLLQGQRVGLVGAGYVGRRVMKLLAPFGVDLSVYDPYLSETESVTFGVRRVDLETLFAQNRIISIHAPSTPETHHMIGARHLSLLEEHAVLVNTARSWSVEQDALLAELARGRIWAALDVFDQEPLPVDHPFRRLDNVLLTPHMAGRSLTTLRRQGEAMVEEIERWIAGKPLQYSITEAMYPVMA
jgi:phosphoglycerate dehydrogenase-like enzyme